MTIYVPIVADSADPQLLAKDWWSEVRLGNVTGRSYISTFGRNPDIGASEEDIWSAGGTYSGWLTSASAIRVKAGGNVNDTAAGTGARKVMVYGLDSTWALAQEELTLAGASASAPTTTTFIRAWAAWVTDVGTYTGANTGDVILETTSGAAVSRIAAGRGQAQAAMITIPAGKVGLLFSGTFSASRKTNQEADCRLYTRHNADVTSAPFTGKRLLFASDGVSGPIDFSMLNTSIPAKTDVWCSAVRGGSSNTSVTALLRFMLVDL